MPVFITSAVLLAFSILNVVKGVKQAHLLSVPLVEQQEIDRVHEAASGPEYRLCNWNRRVGHAFYREHRSLLSPTFVRGWQRLRHSRKGSIATSTFATRTIRSNKQKRMMSSFIFTGFSPSVRSA